MNEGRETTEMEEIVYAGEGRGQMKAELEEDCLGVWETDQAERARTF